MSDQSEFYNNYANKIRTRVCGLLIEEEKILLIQHINVGPNKVLWAPPGGGIELGETAEEALIREFMEECHLKIKVKQFLFTAEFIQMPLHSYELFFEVERVSGHAKLGKDPEMGANQMLQKLAFVTFEDLLLMPVNERHGIFNKEFNKQSLLNTRGYIKLAR